MKQKRSDEGCGTQNITPKRTLLYCGITFGLTWALAALIPLTGVPYGGIESLAILSLCMFMPTVGNILTRLVTRQGFQNFRLAPKFQGNRRNYLFAYLVFIVLIYLGVLLYYLVFGSQFDPVAGYVLQSGAAAEQNAYQLIVAYVLLSTLAAPLVNIIATLGEELGWRGYLLYGLKESCGSGKAVLYTGLIWGIWHAPMIAMGHNYGTDYIGYPVTGILMMVVFCAAVGIVEGYVTLRTDSVIPAAMCHSAINALASIGLLFCNTAQIRPLVGPTYVGIIPLAPTILFAAFILYRIGKEEL